MTQVQLPVPSSVELTEKAPPEPWTRVALAAAGLLMVAIALLLIFNTHLTSSVTENTMSGATVTSKVTQTTSSVSDTVLIGLVALAGALALTGAFFERLRTIKLTLGNRSLEFGVEPPRVISSPTGDKFVTTSATLVTAEGQRSSVELDPELLYESASAAGRVMESRTVTYDLERDSVRVEVETTPLAGKQIRWRTVFVAGDEKARQEMTFAELGLRPKLKGGGAKLVLIPVEERVLRLRAVVMFLPPAERAVRWSYGYTWPGLWTRLRESLTDTSSVTLLEGIDRVVLKFVFPKGNDTGNIEVTETPGQAQPDIQVGSLRSRRTVTLSVKTSVDGSGQYQYTVSM